MLELVHFVRTLSLYLFRMLSAIFCPADQQGPTQLRFQVPASPARNPWSCTDPAWGIQPAAGGEKDLTTSPIPSPDPLAMACHASSHAKMGSFKISGDAQHGMHLLNDAHHCRSIEDGEGVGFPYMLRWWADFHRDLGVGMLPTPMASRSSQHPNKRTKSLLMIFDSLERGQLVKAKAYTILNFKQAPSGRISVGSQVLFTLRIRLLLLLILTQRLLEFE